MIQQLASTAATGYVPTTTLNTNGYNSSRSISTTPPMTNNNNNTAAAAASTTTEHFPNHQHPQPQLPLLVSNSTTNQLYIHPSFPKDSVLPVVAYMGIIVPKYCQSFVEPTIRAASQACQHFHGVGNDDCDPLVAITTTIPNKYATTTTTTNTHSVFHGIDLQSEPKDQEQLVSMVDHWIEPFLLFAGAEVIFATMQHWTRTTNHGTTGTPEESSSSSSSNSDTGVRMLQSLYQKIGIEMQNMINQLCGPLLALHTVSPLMKNHTENIIPNATLVLEQDEASTIETAEWLSHWIQQLIVVSSVRCQLMDVQIALWDSCTSINHQAFTMANAADTISCMLDTLAQNQPIKNVTNSPIATNLVNELRAWKYCFETCAALEQCLFLETIVSLRQWQTALPDKQQDTILSRWMHETYDRIVAILPLYFDRTQTFAKPFYGFDVAALWNSSTCANSIHVPQSGKWNWSVTDFLRKQEKLGGPPTAVALVLDGVATSNLQPERGWIPSYTNACTTTAPTTTTSNLPACNSKTTHNSILNGSTMENGCIGSSWLAVYIRSTMYLSTSTTPTTSNAISRNSGIRMRGSHNSLRIGWSTSSNNPQTTSSSWKSKQIQDCNSPINTDRKSLSLSQTSRMSLSPSSSPKNSYMIHPHYHNSTNVFEYAPDTGTESAWPHNDWKSLSQILDRKKYDSHRELERSGMGTVIAYKYDENDVTTNTNDIQKSDQIRNPATDLSLSHDPVHESTTIFSPQHTVESYNDISTQTTSLMDAPIEKRRSTFHIVSISEWMHLVVMVKEEDNRWHLRRNRLDDDEIKDFVQHLGRNLRLADIVSLESIRCYVEREYTTKKSKDGRKMLQLTLPKGDDTDYWNETLHVQNFMIELENTFGLRSPVLHQDTVHSFSFYGGNRQSPRTPIQHNPRMASRMNRLRQQHSQQQITLPESAAVLFLGSELASLFQ